MLKKAIDEIIMSKTHSGDNLFYAEPVTLSDGNKINSVLILFVSGFCWVSRGSVTAVNNLAPKGSVHTEDLF